MADSTIIPFSSGETPGWDAGVGGAIGGFLGSWFGNGWNGNGFNRGGYGVGPVGAPVAATIANDTLILDGLNNISSQLSGMNNSVMASQAQQNLALSDSSAQTNANIFQTAAATQNGLCSGFYTMNDTLQNVSAQTRFENMNNFNSLQTALSNCCCTTNTNMMKGFGDLALENCQNTGRIVNAINTEGDATRALITQNYITDLQTQLCDAKSKIGSLESQNFTSGALAAQSAVFDAKLTNAINTIVAHVVAK